MTRAKQYLVPGLIWHLTHRCHDKKFLLKFARDRKRWLHWIFQAKKRYGISILNYTVTSNHVHLLVCDENQRISIPRTIQLASGRTAREYNIRKNRSGAFWEDQYHATAVESGKHLVGCMVYIDLNMVRAGVVKHPKDWPFCGYKEILQEKQRYRLIDKKRLIELLEIESRISLKSFYGELINEALSGKPLERDPQWSESLAVGGDGYIQMVRNRMGIADSDRQIEKGDGTFVLKEMISSYKFTFIPEIGCLRNENKGEAENK